MEDNVVKPSECFPSKISSGSDFACGDPKMFPRVGAEYQAEIPQLIKPSFNGGIKVDTSDSSSLGLPVPVTWIHNKAQVNRGLIEITNNHVVASNQDDCVEHENSENRQTTLINVDGELKSESPHTFRGESIDIDSVSLQETKAHLDHSDGFYLVPGLPNKDWKPIENSSFLLGLYIFGKNLALIRRFVGSKGMGDILSYYYGKFYKSKDYQRWSGSRKLRGRRCISGQRLFTGWRQQELLSRLSFCVSEECLYMLIKASKLFGDGNITLEKYVFSLRDKVGIDNLVEAVGIGKGKKDLTGTAMDYTKAIQSLPVRPRLRKTKACSTLTTTEILKFLTGNFRLSKPQLNHIFWKAVWPRLLAQGWHSEKPSGLVSAGIKKSLVFLVPDVNKFSRSLAKGTHFFNSISDVLNKVASEPSLLELKVNSDNGDQQKEKHMINPEVSQNNSACNQHSMKFTVVDTSLQFTGVGNGKVREMRSLLLDCMNSASSGHLSEENHGSDPVDVDKKYGDADDDITSIISKDQLPNGPVSLIKEEKITQSSTEVKPRLSTHSASISEHTNLAVCSNRGLSHNSILDNPEDDQGFSVNTLNNPDSLSAAKSSSPCETEQHSEMLKSCNAGAITEEPTCRRRSSRNKPSAKALEAFAYGFMGASKKRKSANSSTSSQRVRRSKKEANNNNDGNHNENLKMIGEP